MKILRVFLLLLSFALGGCYVPVHGADTPRPMGWKSSPHGVPGADIETHPLFKVAPLPAAASIAQWFHRTDQADRGACVAYTGEEAVDAVHQKDFRGTHMHLSFLDIYQRCLVRDGNFPNDEGTYGGTLLKVLQTGVLTEKTWGYANRLDRLPTETKKTTAERARHITLKSYALPNDDGGFAVKQCIANLKIAALMGTLWYGNGFDAKKINLYTRDAKGNRMVVTRWVLPMPRGNPVGGHEIPIVAYDDNMQFPDGKVGGVEIHNHWAGFGDERGSCWLPQAWAFNPHYAEDKHAIEIIAASTANKKTVPLTILTP